MKAIRVSKKQLEKFINLYNQRQSLDPADYPEFAESAEYILTIIAAMQNEHEAKEMDRLIDGVRFCPKCQLWIP